MAEIHIIFDDGPGPEGCRFVEVEDEHGHGMDVGEWHERPDGYWALVISPDARLAAKDAEIAALKALVRNAPHVGCAGFSGYRPRIGGMHGKPCNCWKSKIEEALR